MQDRSGVGALLDDPFGLRRRGWDRVRAVDPSRGPRRSTGLGSTGSGSAEGLGRWGESEGRRRDWSPNIKGFVKGTVLPASDHSIVLITTVPTILIGHTYLVNESRSETRFVKWM